MRGKRSRELRKIAHAAFPTPTKVGYDIHGTFYGQKWRRYHRILKRSW